MPLNGKSQLVILKRGYMRQSMLLLGGIVQIYWVFYWINSLDIFLLNCFVSYLIGKSKHSSHNWRTVSWMSIICQNQRLWNGYSLLRPCNIISLSSESLSTPRPLNPPLTQPLHAAFLLFEAKPSSTRPSPGAFFHPSPILHIKKGCYWAQCRTSQAKQTSCHAMHTFPYTLIARFLLRSHTSATTGPEPSPCQAPIRPETRLQSHGVNDRHGDTVQHTGRKKKGGGGTFNVEILKRAEK